MSIPSQSQSSPIVHFTKAVRSVGNDFDWWFSSPSISLDSNDDQHLNALIDRPQSTPISSPKNVQHIDKTNHSTNETDQKTNRHPLNYDYSTITNLTQLNENPNQLSSKILLEIFKEKEDEDRHLLRPPPLLVLSQSIQTRHPEQLDETKLNRGISLKKDLPHSPANYSLFFYNFTQTKVEEGRRLLRRMGNCFLSENLDIVTTHLILPKDSPHLNLSLDLVLALIYRCRLVTFEWLQCSSRIGDWVNEKKFLPKLFLKNHPSIDFYRRQTSKSKPVDLFHHCGSIYLTSMVKQRSILVKLISMFGGDTTINRNRAKLIVGYSSKPLPIIIQPQVNEQWLVDSILSGKCLSIEKYLIDSNNSS